MSNNHIHTINKIFTAVDSDDLETLASSLESSLDNEHISRLKNILQLMLRERTMSFEKQMGVKNFLNFLL